MRVLRVILADQLSISISSLEGCDKNRDVILFCELHEESNLCKTPEEIGFLFSAMRHFTLELYEKAYPVDYIKIDDPCNTGSLKNEVSRTLKRHIVYQTKV